MQVGDKVKVPHGEGYITGFEYMGNRTTTISTHYDPLTCLRVRVKLTISNWSFKDQEHYFCSPKEIEPIN
jgi:hypothetical protein